MTDRPWDDDDLDRDDGWGPADGFVDEFAGEFADGFADAQADGDEDRVPTLVFTVSNPPRTVTVSVFINGRVNRVELAPSVTRMTEVHLAEEISIVANLARQKAQAAQHAIIVEFMGELGHDGVATTGFLRRDLGLPSPDDFRAASAEAFAGRYGDDD